MTDEKRKLSKKVVESITLRTITLNVQFFYARFEPQITNNNMTKAPPGRVYVTLGKLMIHFL